MYPTATDGNRRNNRLFSDCSKDQIGQTINSKGNCFIPSEILACTVQQHDFSLSLSSYAEPLQQECGNGIVEGDEECDCKYNDTSKCEDIDPCCLPGECKLKDEAECRLVSHTPFLSAQLL